MNLKRMVMISIRLKVLILSLYRFELAIAGARYVSPLICLGLSRLGSHGCE